MSPPRRPTPHVERRDVSLAELATILRAVVGLPPDRPLPSELATTKGRVVPDTVPDIDAGAWIGWCLVGVWLFAGELPTLARVRAEAGRLFLALAMHRSGGTITGAAARLRISRRALREALKARGLYPWVEALDPRDRRGGGGDGI